MFAEATACSTLVAAWIQVRDFHKRLTIICANQLDKWSHLRRNFQLNSNCGTSLQQLYVVAVVCTDSLSLVRCQHRQARRGMQRASSSHCKPRVLLRDHPALQFYATKSPFKLEQPGKISYGFDIAICWSIITAQLLPVSPQVSSSISCCKIILPQNIYPKCVRQ